MNKYDVFQDELEGKNLIEASAGTGKTYSITVLALRLLLEKEIQLNQILLVTFTNAATAEMKSRLRELLLQAHVYFLREDATGLEDKLKDYLEHFEKVKAKQKIEAAIKQLDELQVTTIDSFFYQTIQEFAFETNMRFNYDMVNDQSEWVNEAIRTYWRKYISPIPKEKLATIMEDRIQSGFNSKSKAFSFDLLSATVKELLKGARLPQGYYSEKDLTKLDWEELINNKDNALIQARDRVKFDPRPLADLSPGKLGIENKTANKNYGNNPLDYYEKVLQQGAGWSRDVYASYGEDNIKRIIEAINQYHKEKGKIYLQHTFGQVYINNSLAYQCFLFVQNELKRLKEKANIKQTNELETDFYNLVKDKNRLQTLQKALSERYKAFFIDEFQDTNSQQSEIFSKLFIDNVVQYFVGDPKQSIYGFRGADIDSYVHFKKQFSPDKIKSLSINYRSTSGYVDKCNQYFKPPFSFHKEGIEYVEVNAKNEDDRGDLHFIGASDKMKTLQQLVLHLLNTEKLYNKKEDAVLPKNIAILTRGGKVAKEAKRAMAQIKVPAVLIADTNIFESEEAGNMLLFCEYLIEQNVSSLKTLMLGSWFNHSLEAIRKLDLQKVDQQLQKVLTVYEKKGFYNAFQQFYQLFNLEVHIAKHQFAERVATNTEQLLEICHSWITQEKLSIYAVHKKLDNLIQAPETMDEYEERIESDAPNLQIMTIHKAKGLQFDIVICPDMPKVKSMNAKHSTFTYKLNGVTYFVANFYSKKDKTAIAKAYNDAQKEEKARLEYVALTRAKQAFYGIVDEKGISSFGDFHDTNLEDTLLTYEPVTDTYDAHYDEKGEERKPLPHDAIDKKVAFSVSSFSNLSLSEHPLYTVETIDQEGYDQFVFNQLKKGADAGNLIHDLFENYDFDQKNLADTVDQIHHKYPKYLINEENHAYFEQLMHHVLNAEIPGLDNFTLSQLTNDSKICEMEFHWKVQSLKEHDVDKLLFTEGYRMTHDFNGFLKGFIDFIFEHNGKYYILDWKSNHIGSTVEDYNQEKMEIAMKANNYHLQHFIYKQAFMTYLKSLYPQKTQSEIDALWGGVVYCFVRGCRENTTYGMYRYEKQ